MPDRTAGIGLPNTIPPSRFSILGCFPGVRSQF
jgi:hypothetical protein